MAIVEGEDEIDYPLVPFYEEATHPDNIISTLYGWTDLHLVITIVNGLYSNTLVSIKLQIELLVVLRCDDLRPYCKRHTGILCPKLKNLVTIAFRDSAKGKHYMLCELLEMSIVRAQKREHDMRMNELYNSDSDPNSDSEYELDIQEETDRAEIERLVGIRHDLNGEFMLAAEDDEHTFA